MSKHQTTREEDKWLLYNATETNGMSSAPEETVSVDIDTEIMYLDDEIVKQSMTATHIAGEKILYSYSAYGKLELAVSQYKIKGHTEKTMLRWLMEHAFKCKVETELTNRWSIRAGILTLGNAKLKGGFLIRNNTILGWYRDGIDVGKTINWYDKAVFKSIERTIMKSHKVIDFRPEVENEVYMNQAPEFTRESELIEMLDFIESLKQRKLSLDELLIISDLKVAIDDLL